MIAALAPSMMGAVHTATDGWTAPLVLLLVVVAVMVAAGLLATAPHRPDAPTAPDAPDDAPDAAPDPG
ncbi:hypothetical protein GCM10025864_26070 [Luteimicrobium album]|uniref:MFS transporter n=1 Tax=Luteimicrobium album TaxID=1054550 RepID=A0ABQ6I4F8_9MICO|nr:hypothetical protein [Luteimicrobium album]GMA24848.1 hypothetical protein GCM10025864_26070 [Luteimicrobium album]